MSFAELVARTIERLDQAEIPYMLTGSLASTFHGEPRATRDVDIIIDPAPAALVRLIEDLVADRRPRGRRVLRRPRCGDDCPS